MRFFQQTPEEIAQELIELLTPIVTSRVVEALGDILRGLGG